MKALSRTAALCVAVLFLKVPGAGAHDPGLSALDLRVADGRIVATLSLAEPDVRVVTDHLGTTLEAFVEESLAVEADGTPLPGSIRGGGSAGGPVEVTFDAPPGSRRLTVRSRIAAQLLPGHRQLLSVRTMTGELLLERMLDAASAAIDVDLSTASKQSKARSFGTLGVTHILGGYDHLLFVGALLLGVRRLGEALRTITAFTVAHSVTLALAALGLASVPSRIVEPLIAASIVFVALDNLRREKTGSRLGLTFAFGLMHGFGFAGALRDAGLQPGLAVVIPLAWFNLGVEAGQLLVALAMWPVVVLLFVPRARSLCLAPACSVLVAAFGAYWLVERTFS